MRPIHTETHPWYREPWPWVLMALPAAAVVAGFITLVIAIRNEDALVADDYYKRGLAINQDLARESRAAELNVRADVSFGDRLLRVILSSNGTMPRSLTVRFVHPTRADADRAVILLPQASGWYEGNLPPLSAGGWRMQVEDAGREWRVSGSWHTEYDSISLGTAPAGDVK